MLICSWPFHSDRYASFHSFHSLTRATLGSVWLNSAHSLQSFPKIRPCLLDGLGHNTVWSRALIDHKQCKLFGLPLCTSFFIVGQELKIFSAEIRKVDSKAHDLHYVHLFIESFGLFIKSSSEVFVQNLFIAPKISLVLVRDNQLFVEMELRGGRPIPKNLLTDLQVGLVRLFHRDVVP